ncbi:NADH-quinone oxidoreductase subunit NuoE [Aeromicrobium wangtongii]|uniref:NADH-quinone oxidoreductase subunit NuoE n=1 Tax=Aeromicrobium wangtongii TaxID=2969247 RepID=UPI002017DAFA|nr:NADH-quinone oxidoreductase subunit NuoE [Aeromicrobium wangtongii]MCL3820222.1 NADH-quinone oxidoreductase subunit NuoE [Aeromicrobium wangtongii]
MTLSETTVGELNELAGRYPQARSALLPMLHLVQSAEGNVTNEGIEVCAAILGISAAEVSGVATFYTMYKRRPMGEHHVGVCTNTLCAVMGGDLIFERLKGHLDVGNDETTEDGMVTLEHIECNAACDFAPVMTVNWEFFDNQTPESAVDLVDRLRAGETVQATRGATITSWRAAERVIAGYEDGLVDEGPTAAGASLAGLRIAKERGWTAPPVGASTGGASTSSTSEGASTGETSEGSKAGAAAEADTSRAETETVIEQSPANTAKEGSDD